MILLSGFGPFRDVADNPSARLVRAAHGRVVWGHRIQAAVLDVAWGVPLRQFAAEAQRLHPALVLGFGVASEREGVQVERFGRRPRSGDDVRGRPPDGPWPAPEVVEATVDVIALAEALGASISDDAGTYLCNGWAHQVVPALACPAAFVHLPAEGMTAERLVQGLACYLTTSPRHRDKAAATS